MSPSKTTRSPRRKRIYTEIKLDELLTEIEKRATVIKAAELKMAASIQEATDKAKKLYDEEVGTAPSEVTTLLAELSAFLVKSRTVLIRRFKKQVIERPMGTVKFVYDEPEMEWPKDEKPVIEAIENRLDGLPFLTVKTTLNKKAIAQAVARSNPSDLYAELRRLKVWRGPHVLISMKSASMQGFLNLEKLRYNEQPLRTKPTE